MENNLDRLSRHSLARRSLVKGLAAGLTTMVAGRSFAQQLNLGEIIAAPRRGDWNDQFDARVTRAVADVASYTPIFSAETVLYVQDAIRRYGDIVAQGGWPTVPASQKLQLGVVDPAVATLRQRLQVSGDLGVVAGDPTVFDTYVEGAVKRFQARHGLPADGIMGNHTYQAMNVPADIRLGQLNTNLVRLQSMSGFLGERYVVVNIPAAEIEAVEGNRVVQRHKAIVGKIDRQTPILSSKIHEIILNPYWTAPRSIVIKDIIPLMQKNPQYLAENHIRLYNAAGEEVAPESIDWHGDPDEIAKLMFRQDPGDINAMASTKINFHNPHAVYMHDTPQQGLFNELMRFESSGCVRVQNVRDLNVWLLKNTPGWDRQRMEQTIASGESVEIQLADPVPVYFTYITAWSTADGVVQFRDDIYHRDGVAQLALR